MKMRKIKKRDWKNPENSRDGIFLGDRVIVKGNPYTIEAIELNEEYDWVFLINYDTSVEGRLDEMERNKEYYCNADILYRKGAKKAKYGEWIRLNDIEEVVKTETTEKKIIARIMSEVVFKKELTAKESKDVREYARNNDCSLLTAFETLTFTLGNIDLDENSETIEEAITDIELEERS